MLVILQNHCVTTEGQCGCLCVSDSCALVKWSRSLCLSAFLWPWSGIRTGWSYDRVQPSLLPPSFLSRLTNWSAPGNYVFRCRSSLKWPQSCPRVSALGERESHVPYSCHHHLYTVIVPQCEGNRRLCSEYGFTYENICLIKKSQKTKIPRKSKCWSTNWTKNWHTITWLWH